MWFNVESGHTDSNMIVFIENTGLWFILESGHTDSNMLVFI